MLHVDDCGDIDMYVSTQTDTSRSSQSKYRMQRTKQLDNKQLSLGDVGTIMFDVCDKAFLMQQFLSRDKSGRRRRRSRWQTASRRATQLIDSRMTALCTAMTASMTTREELTT